MTRGAARGTVASLRAVTVLTGFITTPENIHNLPNLKIKWKLPILNIIRFMFRFKAISLLAIAQADILGSEYYERVRAREDGTCGELHAQLSYNAISICSSSPQVK